MHMPKAPTCHVQFGEAGGLGVGDGVAGGVDDAVGDAASLTLLVVLGELVDTSLEALAVVVGGTGLPLPVTEMVLDAVVDWDRGWDCEALSLREGGADTESEPEADMDADVVADSEPEVDMEADVVADSEPEADKEADLVADSEPEAVKEGGALLDGLTDGFRLPDRVPAVDLAVDDVALGGNEVEIDPVPLPDEAALRDALSEEMGVTLGVALVGVALGVSDGDGAEQAAAPAVLVVPGGQLAQAVAPEPLL
jgi:hypothetical protein